MRRRSWVATGRARALLEARGLSWQRHVLMGEAAETIVRAAERLRSRGIVTGSRGQNRMPGLAVGYKVMQMLRCPVLVVR